MASLIPGAFGYITITINGSYVYETATNYMFALPLSLITSDIFWSNITNSNHIAVWDTGGGGSRPKYSILNIVGKSGVLYWDGALSAGRIYRIYFGKNISVLDSTLAASNSGFTSFSPLCESSGIDIFNFGGTNGTLVAPGSINNTGVVYKAYAGTGASGAQSVTTNADLFGIGDTTISCIIRPSGYGYNGGGRIVDNGYFILKVMLTGAKLYCSSDIAVTNAVSAANSILLNVTYHIMVTRTSLGVINFYINGAQSGTANQIKGIPVAGATTTYYGNASSNVVAFNGTIEQLGRTNNIKTLQYAQNRNAMLMAPNTFFGGEYPITKIGGDKRFRFGFGFGF